MLFFLSNRVKITLSIIISFLISLSINKLLISYFKKIKKYNAQREELNDKAKENTPLFGGISFFISLLLSLLIIDYNLFVNPDIIILLIISSAFLLLGFIDDYLKVFKHNYKGLNALVRTLIELIFIFAFLKYFYIDNLNPLAFNLWDHKLLHLGNFIFILVPLILYGGTNAINLTDGMDGLLTYLYLFSLLPLIFVCLINKNYNLLTYLFILYGSILGFMRYNLKPAKIFMGDTGSLYLGINYLLLAFLLRSEYLIPFSSLIYIIEALSVIIQVISFNVFHKRVFKMSPIHHHFKLIGVSEYKVVFMFTLVGLLSLIISLGLIL